MTVYTPPDLIESKHKNAMFLAGTIDMGNSEDWQAKTIKEFRGWPISIFNPRRSDWNSDLPQSPYEGPLRSQIIWEQEALNYCNILIFNFLKDSKSPITFMELGQFLKDGSKRIFVCCPPEFYRYSNIKVTCEMHGLIIYEDYNIMLQDIKSTLL